MKLHASAPSAAQTITGYGDGYVMVNGARRDSSAVITPERTLPWENRTFARLTREDFAFLATLEVEIVLLGTGARQRFPHPRLTAPLAAARIGLEVMDLKAACRTYNILVAEERKVGLALLFE
jgi:uncharacterized protein